MSFGDSPCDNHRDWSVWTHLSPESTRGCRRHGQKTIERRKQGDLNDPWEADGLWIGCAEPGSLVCEVHVDDNSHGMYCYNYRASYALGNGMKRPESNRAFTLIELLVVISIISLLISMLMPAIKRARGLARMVECSSSLHQLLVGTKAFSTETHDAIPEAYYTDGKRSWLTQVVGDILGVEENVPTSFWCPEESTEQSFTPSGGSYYWGEKSTRTYGMNDWGAANSDAPTGLDTTTSNTNRLCTSIPTRIRQESMGVLLPRLGRIRHSSGDAPMNRPTTSITDTSVTSTWPTSMATSLCQKPFRG